MKQKFTLFFCLFIWQIGYTQTNELFEEDDLEIIEVEPQEEEEPEVFVIVEDMPEFPGGQEAMLEFLYSNIQYPKEASKNGIEGLIVVNFWVMEDGSLTNVEVKRAIGGGCDEEAVRVIKSMPNWIPGKQRGKAVIVSYNLPVRFALTSDKEEKKLKKKK